ncbi:AAA family ATPase|uniref:DNA helicase-2 / ATP-dependent DNA helicase PcrA n=1 Tax=Dendrosporobacter quercicolus TaxID=146817 RepID=A0A1G9T6I8_9FIRM|nr:UvrD-helicase domain-containing protein [Dendrosporobacter quercicolus]NSL48518.1 AAA family ATPase [Dendrosporobacter quercicolus DSM 1736]SDM43242.1 DNA helicase-2 / ATP-dependent DNA helicase PcrA [Dendrosporobacter quercicolus]
MTDSEREDELLRLNRTLAEIHKQLTAASGKCTEAQVELQNNLTDYWQSYGGNLWDEAQMIEAVERQRSITAVIHQGQVQLKQALSSPYFGRFDFIEETSQETRPEPIYVGLLTLTDRKTGEILVYDWRAPVSGMFYDFERGAACYQAPMGKVNGIITLKRQYKIIQGQMKYMFDSDLKIDDDILQEILSKSVDAKMHTIVTSIQREQNQVIRNDENQLLLVQGPAGSGKTSIALHRIAYLLYRDRKTINAQNILIFSPNHIFSDYISNVLPEMGEENVRQTTFQDYIASFKDLLPIEIESRAAQLEYVLTGRSGKEFAARLVAIHYKTSPEFAGIIDQYLSYYENQLVLDYPDITFGSRMIFSKAEWLDYYLTHFSFLPPLRRLTKIRELIHLRIRPLTHELRRQKEAEIVAAGEEINEQTIKALARVAARQELGGLISQIDKLTQLQPLTLYRRLFTHSTLFKRLSAGTSVPPEWPAICRQTRAWLNQGKMPYEDSPAFLYFQGILAGFPAKNTIKYLVVDEAQDYTVLQYKILGKLFPDCSWTILGDPAQLVHPYIQGIKFEQLSQLAAFANPRMITLSRSYRSTQEIQAFCNALLPAATPVAYLNRRGPLPQVVKFDRLDPAKVLEALQSMQAAGCRSIAVICKTIRQASALHQTLPSHRSISLIVDEDAEFKRGIVIIPAFLAKGLEFDGVLVYNANSDNYCHEQERKLLYTVCTRALHRLMICWNGRPSPFIEVMKKSLYQTN